MSRPSFAPGSYHFVIAVWRAKATQSDQVKYWEIIADNLSKAGGVGAVSQRLIPKGERSGLLTRIAATESVWLCERIKS
jgi:hypothetical protein